MPSARVSTLSSVKPRGIACAVAVSVVEVEDPEAQATAEMVVEAWVGLIAHRFGRTERGQQAGLGELCERRVDGAAPEIGKLPEARA